MYRGKITPYERTATFYSGTFTTKYLLLIGDRAKLQWGNWGGEDEVEVTIWNWNGTYIYLLGIY